MNVFVSYTCRDGEVSGELLKVLHEHLRTYCEPFVHLIEAPRLKHQQLGVLKALLNCQAIVLVVSPAVRRSPWVRLELALGRLLRRPVVQLDVAALRHFAHMDP